MNKVVNPRQVQNTQYVPHSIIRWIAEGKLSQETKCQIDNAENETEGFRAGQRARKTTVKGQPAGDEMDDIVRWCQMSTEQVWRKESTDSYKKKNDA